MTQTQLLACLAALDIKTEDGYCFASKTERPMFKRIRKELNALLEGDFLLGKSRSMLMLNRSFVELLTQRLIADNQFTSMAEVIQKTLNLTPHGLAQAPSLTMDQIIAGMRILFYQKKVEQATELYENVIKRVPDPLSLLTVWQRICCSPFDPDWFCLLPPDIHTEFLGGPFLQGMASWMPNDFRADYLESLVMKGSEKCESDLEAAVLEKWMLTGEQDLLKTWLKKYGKKPTSLENSLCLQGWMAFCKGKNTQSISLYEKALALLNKKTNGKKKIFFSQFMGLFYILALIKEGSDQCFVQARKCLAMGMNREYSFKTICDLLGGLLEYLQGNSRGGDQILSHRTWNDFTTSSSDVVPAFFTFFSYYWVDIQEAAKELQKIKNLHKLAKKHHYSWFAGELEGLIQILSTPSGKTVKKKNPSCLVGVTSQTKVWEHTLNALLSLNKKAVPGKRVDTPDLGFDQRMAWFLDYDNNGECDISPREQKRNAKGVWTKGRPVALKRLCNEIRKFPYLTAQDKKICGHIYAHTYKDGWYTNVEYVFDDDYMPDVVGHPFLFSSDGTTRIEVVPGKPELIISKKGKDSFTLALSPDPGVISRENM